MPGQSVFIQWSSPASKRKLGRAITWVCLAIVILATWSLISNYGPRKAKGYDPIPISSIVIFIAPLAMIALGLFIGWGQTRIDFNRGTVENRPFGLPFIAKVRPLSRATRLFVGFFRGPTTFATANSGPVMGSGGGIFWYVRIDGPDLNFLLIRQRPREEALAFAEDLSARINVPVEVADAPGN